MSKRKPKDLISYNEFQSRGFGGWKEYKFHLQEHGALSPNLDVYETGVKKNHVWDNKKKGKW